MSHVLIVDDEPSICWALEKFLDSRGHSASAVSSAEEALELLAAHMEPGAAPRPDLVLLDVRLPGMDGLRALEMIRDGEDPPPVIVITAHGTMDTAVEAMRRGAFDYLTKPLDLDAADAVVRRALVPLQRAEGVPAPPGEVGRVQLVGSSPAMQRVYKQIGTLATSDATVLISGESGTGKELVARMIHQSSAREHQPFEPLVCASLPETLLESELYGYEAGAFTGATRRMIGRFERANGGTLLLDEVSEIPLASQVKLLRFLEERTIERLGGGDRIPLDVRLVAATNRLLEPLVAEGAFREDLFYRLRVVEIELPPLRERTSDIPELVGAFLAGRESAGISREALDELQRYFWPGNVRELRHAVEHALALARGQLIAPEHLPPYLGRAPERHDDALRALLEREVQAEVARDEDCDDLYERLLLRWEAALLPPVMDHTGNNQLRAAGLLGVSRGTLRKKLRQHGLLAGPDDE